MSKKRDRGQDTGGINGICTDSYASERLATQATAAKSDQVCQGNLRTWHTYPIRDIPVIFMSVSCPTLTLSDPRKCLKFVIARTSIFSVSCMYVPTCGNSAFYKSASNRVSTRGSSGNTTDRRQLDPK